MKRILYQVLFVATLVVIFSSCRQDGFTKDEVRRIESGAKNEIMALFTIDCMTDSLLLRQNARPIKPKHIKSETVQYLTKRMLATVKDPSNTGVGIAAPQVGISVRMLYVQRLDKKDEPFEVYFNPVIEHFGDSLLAGREGCLSVPNYRGEVSRAQRIGISYYDSLGNFVKEEIKGFTAVIFQHEIDHINGVLYYDRIDDGFDALYVNE